MVEGRKDGMTGRMELREEGKTGREGRDIYPGLVEGREGGRKDGRTEGRHEEREESRRGRREKKREQGLQRHDYRTGNR